MDQNTPTKSIIITFSPNGSTLKLAKAAIRKMLSLNFNPTILDITNRSWDFIENFDYSTLKSFSLFIFAFPIYAWNIAEPMEKFMLNIPSQINKYAAIIATYGGVAVGKSMQNAVTHLLNKNYTVIGAAKIVSRHSTIFDKSKDPFSTHPNHLDLMLIRNLIIILREKIYRNIHESINIQKLDSNSKLIRFLSSTLIARKYARKFPPNIRFNHKKCMQCGLCKKVCPVQIIHINSFPEKTGICLRCHNCKRICPSGAIKTTGIWRKIIFHKALQMLLNKTGGERPWSQIYH